MQVNKGREIYLKIFDPLFERSPGDRLLPPFARDDKADCGFLPAIRETFEPHRFDHVDQLRVEDFVITVVFFTTPPLLLPLLWRVLVLWLMKQKAEGRGGDHNQLGRVEVLTEFDAGALLFIPPVAKRAATLGAIIYREENERLEWRGHTAYLPSNMLRDAGPLSAREESMG